MQKQKIGFICKLCICSSVRIDKYMKKKISVSPMVRFRDRAF